MKIIFELDAFKGLSAKQVKSIYMASKIESIFKDTIIVHKDQKLGCVLGVLKGKVALGNKSDSDQTIKKVSFAAGSTLGWLSILDGQHQRMTMWAEEDSELLILPKEKALDALFDFKTLNKFVINKFVETIRKQQLATDTLALPGAHKRIFMYILQLAQQDGKFVSELKLPKQEEIAQNVNSSRETVSRALGLLTNQGVVVKEGHKLKIVKLAAIQKLASLSDNGSKSSLMRDVRESI